jgi:glutamyl-tRNA synthetase
MDIRVRFAPSPTGHLHVGNARTALFNYLFARSMGGTFILRIEDTDVVRSTTESEEQIYEDLNWLGVDWDEGPIKGGCVGPYRQSERLEIYKKYINLLLSEKKAYPCFCTKEELEEEKNKAIADGRPQIYSGKCRNLSDGEVAEKINAGKPYSIRFAINRDYVFVDDLIHGVVNFPTKAFGDFIIVRPDGMPIYNFVVVVDDALMRISHVIRGDDHLSNTPKQILLFEALGMSTPCFAHIPMILGPDRSKLSKRHGVTSIATFREIGYLPEALFNYLALLGWSPGGGREFIKKDEIVASFNLKNVSKSAAIFDFEKLKWLNGLYIRDLSDKALAEMVKPFLIKDNVLDEETINSLGDRFVNIVASVKDNLVVLSDISKYTKVYFSKCEPEKEAIEFIRVEKTKFVLEELLSLIGAYNDQYLDENQYKEIVNRLKAVVSVKGKKLFMTMRVGISGRVEGPELKLFYTNISVKEIQDRINLILQKI